MFLLTLNRQQARLFLLLGYLFPAFLFPLFPLKRPFSPEGLFALFPLFRKFAAFLCLSFPFNPLCFPFLLPLQTILLRLPSYLLRTPLAWRQ